MTTAALQILGLVMLLARPAAAQLNCAEAPTPSLKIMCEQISRWDKNARASPAATSPVTSRVALPPGIDPAMAAGGFDLPTQPTTLEQCTDLNCVCSFLQGSSNGNSCTLRNGQPLRKALRKEYRTLTDEERQRYHAAVRTIKNNGAYDRISKVHSDFSNSGAAHSGPAFLPWHREFIKRYELALRAVDPTVALPYWDSVLDNNLPKPQDSVLWTNELAGTTDSAGNIVGGPFAPWRTMDNRPNARRAVGAQGSLFRETEIAYIMSQTQVENVLAYSAPRQGCPIRADWNWLEYTHGNVHIYVGGDMLDTSTSSNDPIFFMHHSFVDLIFEMWRQSRQTRAQRESDYPIDQQACSAPQHFNGASMAPFTPWFNRDGLSNRYTDYMYEYAPRPTCPSCGGSRFLFCMRSGGQPRCSAKVKVGGSCSGLNEADHPCYNGACRGGVCVETVRTTPTPATTRAPTVTTFVPPTQTQETCFNENECCSTWQTQGECGKNPGYMNSWCKASCGQCRPRYSLSNECSDRHPNCVTWSRQGECSKNKNWMFENCRQSCARCSTSRASVCGGGGSATRQPTRQPANNNHWAAKCTSPGCFNENICCAVWAMDGQCRTNATYMACNCRVSCGQCIPQDYMYGTCTDYHQKCTGWAQAGECNKNPWMKENCRFSCQTCLTGSELRSICRSGGSIPTRTQQQWNQGFGGFGPMPPPNPWGGRGGGGGGWGLDGIDFGPFAVRWGRDVANVQPRGAPSDNLAA